MGPEVEKLSRKSVVVLYLDVPDRDNLKDEFLALVEAAGKDIVEMFAQSRYPTSSHYFGPGFIEQLTEDFDRLEKLSTVEEVIVSTQLSPLQYYNIAVALPERVQLVDKYQLVLEIFEQRVSTLEAKLQIDLARLQYTHTFEKNRLQFKIKGGRFGTERRGYRQAGESKFAELIADFRRKEAVIRQKLDKIKQDRTIRRGNRTKNRDFILRLSLAGYTNAGKSSLLNALTESTVAVQDQLFTTLSTTTRSFTHKDLPVLITDTVGFMQDLPTELIEAFHSTLEESLETDFVAVVADGSEKISMVAKKIETTLAVLKDIGVQEEQIWMVFNKIDKVEGADLDPLRQWTGRKYDQYPHCFVSAKNGEVGELLDLIDQTRPARKYQVLIPASLQKTRSELYGSCEVLGENIEMVRDEAIIQLQVRTRRPAQFFKVISDAENLSNSVSYVELV